VFIVVTIYFVTDSVRKLLDTPSQGSVCQPHGRGPHMIRDRAVSFCHFRQMLGWYHDRSWSNS